ncbi:DUF996 domain-containing protein [Marinilabilia salmonicolor]|uniref:DUF996 domain-containing protein n=1 Tax=Marinilabilia salmonicolor TaxID=989 RepID=UPI00029A7DFC|nr:DUF996 domain-containing protein [Marinilabilia salmonicolor]
MKKQAITLGRIGILLPIASFIPLLGSVAGLASFILLLMSYHQFSKAYENPPIFKKALIGYLVPIIASIIGTIVILIGAGSAFVSLSADGFDPENIQHLMTVLFESGVTIFGLLLLLGGSIIGAFYMFQGLKALAASSGVNNFKTAGLLYFIGAIGLLLFGLGALVMFVAWIIHIVAYFSIQAEEPVVEQAA